jgi:hypothetical protein
MTYQDDHDDVVVEREGTGVGTILGIILAVVVVLAIIWFFFLGGMNSGNGTNPNNGTDTTNQTQVQQQQPPANQPGNGY